MTGPGVGVGVGSSSSSGAGIAVKLPEIITSPSAIVNVPVVDHPLNV